MTHPAARDKAFEADDPLELVPVSFPMEEDEAADRDTARCLVEEFALQGWSSQRISELFRSPHYLATWSIFRRRGPAFVDGIIADVLGGGTR
jgi:hypothetical protein